MMYFFDTVLFQTSRNLDWGLEWKNPNSNFRQKRTWKSTRGETNGTFSIFRPVTFLLQRSCLAVLCWIHFYKWKHSIFPEKRVRNQQKDITKGTFCHFRQTGVSMQRTVPMFKLFYTLLQIRGGPRLRFDRRNSASSFGGKCFFLIKGNFHYSFFGFSMV